MRNPFNLMTEAFSTMTSNIMLFLGILLVPAIFVFVSALFAPTQAEMSVGTGVSGTYIALSIVSAIVNIFMGIALIIAVADRSVSVSEAYRRSVSVFWKYIGMSIVMSIALLVGFLLLIIPGIILAIWFSFGAFVLVLENGGVIQSLKQSREYVRGHWWGVFGRIVVLGILMVVISLVFSAFGLVSSETLGNAIVSALAMLLAPFSVAYMYFMYQDLKGGSAVISQ